jgi:hypothetical protein
VILKFLASSIALAVVIGLSVVGIVGPAAATGDVEYVEVNNDGSISGWYDGGSGIADAWSEGTHLGGRALKLSIPGDKTVTVMKELAMEPPSSGSATAVSQMTDLFDNGLGYTVDGMNANLQLSLRFKPKNPAADKMCGTRNDFTAGSTWDGWCWTILKYEPNVGSTGWVSRTMVNPLQSDDTGWWGNTSRGIGANVPPNTWYKPDISYFTDEMSEVVIVGFGGSIGSGGGTTPLVAWVKDITFNGTTYAFSAAPAVATSTEVNLLPLGSAVAGTAVTITGSVSPSIAAGRIEIFDGMTRLGGGAVTDGAFTLITSALRAGSHSLTATFTPTNAGKYQTSTSTAGRFTVNNAVASAPPARTPVQTVAQQQRPVVTEQTPPPPPATAQRVLTEFGSSTAQLLEVFQAVNKGDAPPAAAQVLTIADGELEAGTGAILPTTTFVASMPWSGSNDDQWVDVWAYSTPTYIGTFPVINGVLKITGADLSALAAGDHDFVLVGQTSGASEVMGFAIAEPASVPGDNVTADPDTASPDVAAGSPDLGWLLWVGIGALAIAAITTIGIVVRRRRV